jgi:hypothetical protein
VLVTAGVVTPRVPSDVVEVVEEVEVDVEVVEVVVVPVVSSSHPPRVELAVSK